MAEFDACYFCGAAVDAPITEYDVVPAGVSDGPGPTVSLCPSCRGKLENVLEPVLGRIDTFDATSTISLDPADGGELTEAEPDTAEPPTADSGTDIGTDTEIDDEPAETQSPAFEDGIEVEPAEAEETQQSTDTGQSESATDDPLAGPDGTAVETETTSTGGAVETETASSDVTVETTDRDAPERPETETYNRVVRLLQNREFPVDRGEFETLASSAYDVTPSECERVIDYAIYRDELDEQDGMLQKPDSA